MYTATQNNKTHSVIDSALTCKDIITNIISYLPTKQQIKSCKFVSSIWREATNNVPLTMRIEDRNKDQIWKYDPISNVSTDSLKNEVHYPLYNIDNLPMSVRGKVTKLTLVLRFVKKYSNRYNLDSILNVFEGFSKLEDLTIISEIKFDVLNHPLPLLRKFKADGCWFHYMKSLVSVAPNLEHINTRYLTIDDSVYLLSLSDSLQKIQTSRLALGMPVDGVDEYDDDGINPIIDSFLDQMPSLVSWQLGQCWRQKCLLKPDHRYRSPIQKPELLDSTEWITHADYKNRQWVLDKEEKWSVLLEIVIGLFLKLKEGDKEEDKTRVVTIFKGLLDEGYHPYKQDIIDLVCVQNIGKMDVRQVISKEFQRERKEHWRRIKGLIYDDYATYFWRTRNIPKNVLWLLGTRKRQQKQQKLSKFQQNNTHSFKEEISPSGALMRKYY